MIGTDIYYLLALQKVKNIGDISAKKLLRHFGSAKAVFEAARKNQINVPEIGTVMTQSLKAFSDWKKVEQEIQFIEKNNIRIITIFDDEYPHKLFHAPDGPVLFFWKGNTSLSQQRIISIVGTRNMTAYGKRIVAELIEELARYKPLIVSGLAYGIDVEAHKNALKHNLPTIGVLGHGFQQIYPGAHRKIAEMMLKNGGLITEFWHSDPVDRVNFLKRNRIVAGMSEATIIIESGTKGGSLVTADIANSYNRDVLAVPGRINDKYSKGCNRLIKQNKAAILTTAQDLAEMLQWNIPEKIPPHRQLNLFVDLNDDEQKIFDLLQEKSKLSLDEIAIHLQFPVSKTAQLLLMLELNGIVQSLPGKTYELI